MRNIASNFSDGHPLELQGTPTKRRTSASACGVTPGSAHRVRAAHRQCPAPGCHGAWRTETTASAVRSGCSSSAFMAKSGVAAQQPVEEQALAAESGPARGRGCRAMGGAGWGAGAGCALGGAGCGAGAGCARSLGDSGWAPGTGCGAGAIIVVPLGLPGCAAGRGLAGYDRWNRRLIFARQQGDFALVQILLFVADLIVF